MSGICAVWQDDTAAAPFRTLARVAGGLSIEAPETTEQHVETGAGIAISSRFATQQLYADENTAVCCDADLLNEDDLARLIDPFEPGPDRTAHLIASLYERFGRDFVAKLRGGFSIILLDHHRRELLAAVDHFGTRRLFYSETPRGCLIASRIQAILSSGQIPRDIMPRAIADLVNFSVSPGPGTTFRAVHRIPPGSMLVMANGAARVTPYWDLRYGTGNSRNVLKLAREMARLVETAVFRACRQNSFERLGAFLSGGTDSSTIVGMMSRLKRGPVNAFSIGFAEHSFDELEYALIAAESFGAQHHAYFVTADDCCEALPHMVRHFDEPFGNSSAIPTYFCARLAAWQGMEVLLGGDGGDELFGGNEAYRTDQILQLYQRVPGPVRKLAIEPLLNLPFETSWLRRARSYVRRASMPAVERMLSYHFLRTHRPQVVFDSSFLEELREYSICDAINRYYSAAPAKHPLDRRLYADIKTVLGDSDLPKVTCMCELAGIQARFPFLDVDVAEFSGRIPADFKVNRLEKRYLFRRAFRSLLPPKILAKPKHGFGIPVAIWMKSDSRMRALTNDVLRSQRTRERGYFRPGFLDELFRSHESDETTYYGDALWVFLTLELWHREFVDQPVVAA